MLLVCVALIRHLLSWRYKIAIIPRVLLTCVNGPLHPHGSHESKCFDISGAWHMSSAYGLSWSLWLGYTTSVGDPQVSTRYLRLPARNYLQITPADPDQLIPTGPARSRQAYQNFADTCRLPAWPNKYPKYELYSANICSVAAKKKMRWRHLILPPGVLHQNLPHHQSEFAKSH